MIRLHNRRRSRPGPRRSPRRLGRPWPNRRSAPGRQNRPQREATPLVPRSRNRVTQPPGCGPSGCSNHPRGTRRGTRQVVLLGVHWGFHRGVSRQLIWQPSQNLQPRRRPRRAQQCATQAAGRPLNSRGCPPHQVGARRPLSSSLYRPLPCWSLAQQRNQSGTLQAQKRQQRMTASLHRARPFSKRVIQEQSRLQA